MQKWAIYVKPSVFSEVVWQSEEAFTSEQLNEVLANWSDIVQTILVCLAEGKTTEDLLEKLDGDYYPLGDLANFLDNIEIKTKTE